jgi:chemotaxis protein CheX
LDEAVQDVFQSMLSLACSATEAPLTTPPGYCARISFSGALDAHCIVEFPAASAHNLTNAFLGSAADWDDTMVADAVGELCNMIAGGWKKRLGAPAWQADLSLPIHLARTRPLHAGALPRLLAQSL